VREGSAALASLICMLKVGDTARSLDKPVSVQGSALNCVRGLSRCWAAAPTPHPDTWRFGPEKGRRSCFEGQVSLGTEESPKK